jgi:hypothetical protein
MQKGVALYKAIYLDTIDNVFVIARALRILHARYRVSGVRGAFAQPLVQYGFTNREGGPMNKAIVSQHETLLVNEIKVRAWWKTVPERTKRDWLSAAAIYRHWMRSKKPPDAPRKPSAYAQIKATNIELQEQLHEANVRLQADGNQFDLDKTGAETIGKIIARSWRQQPKRIETLISTPKAELTDIRALIRAARPKVK